VGEAVREEVEIGEVDVAGNIRHDADAT
jgi:hypothetical protein